jgi:hypothetical protein
MCYSLGKETIVAFVTILESTSISGLKSGLEPVEVSVGLETDIFSAFHAVSLRFNSVQFVCSVGKRVHHIEFPASELSTLIVDLIEYSDKWASHERFKGISRFLGDVVGGNEAVTLFHTEKIAVFSNATSVLSRVMIFRFRTKSTTFFKCLLFYKPIAVNFWNTVFTHFYIYTNKFFTIKLKNFLYAKKLKFIPDNHSSM